MTRRRTHILLIAALGAALPLLARAAQDQQEQPNAQEQQPSQAHEQQSQEPQVFKASAELVVLHVNVFNGRSDAVPNLPRSAFAVYEDDKPQDIAFFEAGDVPVTVGLVIDNSTSMLTERQLVVAGTKAFAESSHPEDQMFAVVFNEHVRRGLPDTIEFTTNRMQLAASLTRFTPGGKTALYDAVIAGLDQLEKGAYQKHVLVVLSDGGDNASLHTEKEMLDRVESSSALIYTVVDPEIFAPGEGNRGVLRRLAKMSGGLAYFPKNERDLVEDFKEIAGNIRRGYSIGYAPASASHEHNRPHRVKVTVRVPGRNDLSVRVRNGYAESDSPGTR
jgi:Ca-activated chloride channel family protein